MGRREELYILAGLVIAVLSCAAGWLALPQVQDWLNELVQNSLFMPLVGTALLALGLAFVARDRIIAQARALLPKGRLETRYLKAVDNYLRRTPAMLVISERNETQTEIDLLEAFSQLTLGPDPEEPDVPLAAPPPPPARGGLWGMFGGKAEREAPPRSFAQRLFNMLIMLVSHAVLVAVALLFIRSLLFTSAGTLRLTWDGALLAFGVVLAWVWAAVQLQRRVVRRLVTMLDQRGRCSAAAATPGAEIWAHPRLLIMGDPGSGKTTLLRHIAVVCAQELLRKPGRQRLRSTYGWPVAPFPIYIPLRALRDAAIKNCPLLESYAKMLREVTLLGEVVRDLPDDFFQRRVERGGCIILLDAFDELRDPQARKWLGQLVANLHAGTKGAPNRIVVTSRIFGYENQLRVHGFTHRRLADLSDEQVNMFIHQRYNALAKINISAAGEKDLTVRARRLISRLTDNHGLRRLRRNPFLLSLIVSVHLKSPRELPRQRHALYERTMAMLVEEWDRWKDDELDLEPTTSGADLEADLKLRLLYELAWTMYERTLDTPDDRSHTMIIRSAAEQVLATTLREIPSISAGRTGTALDSFCRSEADRWLRNLSDRGGVLQELGNVEHSDEAQIQFAHQTFQEYLASQAIDSSTPDTQRLRTNRLYERWNDERWREVLLLYSSTTAAPTALLNFLLAHNHEYADQLAGAVLAEQPRRLEQAPLEETLERLRRRLFSATVPATSAVEALNTLAETGLDPVKAVLEQAALRSPHLVVRLRAIERLAGMEPNRPASAQLAAPIQTLMLNIIETEQDSRLRLAASFALARGDPRFGNDGYIPALVHVPAGPFLMGSKPDDKEAESYEKPQRQIELPAFWIAKTPVTNAQWRYFIEAGGYRQRRYWSRAGWRWLRCGWEPKLDYTTPQIIAIFVLGPLFDPLVGLLLRRQAFCQPHPESWDDPNWNGANQPVTGISFYEAEAYCRWLSEQTGHPFRLPSEAEWEKAARGVDGRRYPWGETWETGRCNSREERIDKPTPVGSFPRGAGPYDTLDMAGNVWEWCATPWRSVYAWGKPDLGDRLLNILVWWLNARVLRGGSCYNSREHVRGAYRINNYPRARDNDDGLRVASRSPMPGSDS